MRSIHDLLILLRAEVLKRRKLNCSHKIYDSGLCRCISELYYKDVINRDERYLLRDYLYDHQPKNKRFYERYTYFWPSHLIVPRLSWCTKHINLTNPEK